jgi:hypothetical protein
MKSPKLTPQPLGKLKLDKPATETSKYARPTHHVQISKQPIIPAPAEVEQTCAVVESEEE